MVLKEKEECDLYALGYETEIGNKKDEAPMQLVPRKIQAQNLKKQPIIGVAASRVHSVIYTSSDLYTFGLNQGQLGYSQSNSSETCQTTPRKATLSIPTRVFMPVKIQQVIANDNATVILTETSDVYMLCNYTQQKLFFPFNTYPSNIKVYKPAVCYIVKLISSGTEYLGALTNLGHVFIWICKSTTKQSANNKNPTIVSAPQLIWATGRTRLMAVDASIGQYGEVIICTASGRVFMGRPESGKYRFSEMPYIQRCIRVCANSSGAFAAIRSEHPLQPSPPGPSTLKQDLYQSLPHVIRGRELESEIDDIKNQMKHDLADIPEEDETSRALIQQRFDEQKKAMVDQAWDDIMQRSIDDRTLDTVFIIEENKRLYCHSSVLATRSHIFKQLGRMADKQIGDFKIRLGKGKDGRIQIHIERCELVSLLLMFDYIYSDEYEHPMKVFFESPALSQDRVEDTRKIQKDLVDLAELFHLPHLLASAQSSFNHQSTPSLLHSLQMLMDYRPDVMLKTRDKHIPCHEVILRQRCVFFKHLLAPQSVWAAKRREQQKDCIEIDMEHMSSEIAETIRQHLYLDTDAPYLFEFIQRDTEDTMLQFLLELLCEADALLLERLKLIVENALIPFIKLRTATNILEHADIYCANVLKQRGLEFIKVNLSVFLPSRMLDRLPSSLIHELENLVRLSQAEVCPLATRGDFNGTDMIDATEIEDDEFSTSLYALSRGNGTLTSAYDEILVTLYPEKPVSNVETKEEQEKERDVDKRVNKSKKAVRIPLQELIEDTQANIAYNWASSPEPTTGVRPSLREILEEEHQTTDTVSKLAKSSLPKKISQKERKKLQQQLQEPSSSSSHQTNKHVWGKVAPAPVKSFVKTMEDEQQQQQQHPQQQKQKQQRDLDTKGKKIYVSEEDLLPPVRETIPTTESKELAYDPIERISSTFNLTPIRRYIKRASLQNHESTIQSFETIQKQQELEDNWSKNGQPKKNLLRIQKEEQAIVGLEQYYIQSLDVMSGEWCEIHRISQEKKSVHRNK
ncbi:hypothetical protein RMATCC62417_04042 [Rhizopus microsporus]|nr:hypothetical protein RMATCC62417_04042 [Rhizopus microsporus]